jgi:hypothetical protein
LTIPRTQQVALYTTLQSYQASHSNSNILTHKPAKPSGEQAIMPPTTTEQEKSLEEPRYIDFPHLPDDATRDGKPVLNKYSSTVTREHDFPGAQVYLACTALINEC